MDFVNSKMETHFKMNLDETFNLFIFYFTLASTFPSALTSKQWKPISIYRLGVDKRLRRKQKS